MRFSRLAEQQIRKAEALGQLSGLKGEGKPLPEAGPGDFAEAAGFRIMHEAGALPKEISLRKEIELVRADYAAAATDAERKAVMARLADLEMRLAIEAEARRKFMTGR